LRQYFKRLGALATASATSPGDWFGYRPAISLRSPLSRYYGDEGAGLARRGGERPETPAGLPGPDRSPLPPDGDPGDRPELNPAADLRSPLSLHYGGEGAGPATKLEAVPSIDKLNLHFAPAPSNARDEMRVIRRGEAADT
jgi:hypothetical protein